ATPLERLAEQGGGAILSTPRELELGQSQPGPRVGRRGLEGASIGSRGGFQIAATFVELAQPDEGFDLVVVPFGRARRHGERTLAVARLERELAHRRQDLGRTRGVERDQTLQRGEGTRGVARSSLRGGEFVQTFRVAGLQGEEP